MTWSDDQQGGDATHIITQTLSVRPVPVPRRVAIVIDGSLSMRAAKAQLSEALAALPPVGELAFVFAGDEAPTLVAHDRADPVATRRFLDGLDFKGGRDNSEALASAWDWAASASGSAVVWIHGAQPELMETLDPLLQRLERRAGQVTLHDVEVAPGPNLIARKIDGLVAIDRVQRSGSLGADVRRLFDQWQPGARQVVVTRSRQTGIGLDPASKTSSHLTRLWALGQVAALSDKPARIEAAIAMANRYQLVTPVSGAVVLESRAQYDEAGLEPVAPGSVPTIPEPETWLLILVVLFMLGLHHWRRRAA